MDCAPQCQPCSPSGEPPYPGACPDPSLDLDLGAQQPLMVGPDLPK